MPNEPVFTYQAPQPPVRDSSYEPVTIYSHDVPDMPGQTASSQNTVHPAGNSAVSHSGSTLPQQLNMRSGLSDETIMNPESSRESYLGSLKAILRRNRGYYIVATFLVGTQNTVTWEGTLYEIGNDYLTIYQSGRDRYIVCDIYSLKYLELYDTRRQEICNMLLREQEPYQDQWPGSANG